MARGDEKQWVESLQAGLVPRLVLEDSEGAAVKVCIGCRLAYAHEILRYSRENVATSRSAGYQTDLLIYDEYSDSSWIPRVVVECKLGGVTTHDALTYSTKAATHKHVHPYLRYGILIGAYGGRVLPGRLIRHGAYFDFMAVVEGADLTDRDWAELSEVLR